MFIKYYNNMFKGDNKNHTGRQLLIYGYLFTHRNMRDEINFSLEELILGCGYSINSHIGKSNELFGEDLIHIIQQNKSGHFDIKPMVNIKQINLTQRIILYLGEIVIEDNFQYTKLPFSDFDIITSCGYKQRDNLILVYLYLKSHFFERKQDNSETAEDKPIGYAIDYDHIAEDIGLCKSAVFSAVNYLCDLGLLYKYTTGGYKDKKGKIRNVPNIYTLPIHKDEVKYLIKKLQDIYKVDRFYDVEDKKNKTN